MKRKPCHSKSNFSTGEIPRDFEMIIRGTKSELTPKQSTAIVALLNGSTVATAADEAGVSEATMYRWLSQPLFRNEYRRQRRTLFERAVSAAQLASATAVSTAVDVMRNSDNDFARLTAARMIIEFARQSDVEQRLIALEEQI